nr:GGDEF domain-containing protein [uncultured Duganella sp.]
MNLQPAHGPEAGLLRQRRSGRSFWHMMSIGCRIAQVAHALFALVFYAVGVSNMVWVNGLSVLIYAAARLALKRHRNGMAIALIWFEIITHAALAVALIGWSSGFHYYLMVMLPLIFVSPGAPLRRKASKGMLLLAIYLALDAYTHTHVPQVSLSAEVLMLLRWFNISTCFLMLALLANVYHKTVLASEQRLRAIASTDPLTGALNRRAMVDEVEALPAAGKPSTLMLADIDLFKRINDEHGHEVGDRVLVRVVDTIAAVVRPQDRIARWGGEEFLICVVGDASEAAIVAERVRADVAALRIVDHGRALSVSLTIGAAARRPGETIERCVARADAALYRGKQAGRNRVMIAGDEGAVTA